MSLASIIFYSLVQGFPLITQTGDFSVNINPLTLEKMEPLIQRELMDKLLKELRSPKKSSREPSMVLLRMMN